MSPLALPSFSRRGRKKERTRREIYDAAMALFAARGYAGVTILATPEAVAHAQREAAGLAPLLESLVQRGQERGELQHGVHARLAAVSLLATAGAILNGRVWAEGELSDAELRRQMLELWFSGLGSREEV